MSSRKLWWQHNNLRLSFVGKPLAITFTDLAIHIGTIRKTPVKGITATVQPKFFLVFSWILGIKQLTVKYRPLTEVTPILKVCEAAQKQSFFSTDL